MLFTAPSQDEFYPSTSISWAFGSSLLCRPVATHFAVENLVTVIRARVMPKSLSLTTRLTRVEKGHAQ